VLNDDRLNIQPSGLNIYALPLRRRTCSFAADRVFRIAMVLASPSVVPAAWGPVALAAKLVADHGAGRE
jgi:hypothetical protein